MPVSKCNEDCLNFVSLLFGSIIHKNSVSGGTLLELDILFSASPNFKE